MSATWSIVTHAATSLTGIERPSKTVLTTHYSAAAIATVNASIINDQNTTQHLYQSFTPNGVLVIPNRGVLRVLAGDVVAVDINGWPIVISAQSFNAGNAWTGTP